MRAHNAGDGDAGGILHAGPAGASSFLRRHTGQLPRCIVQCNARRVLPVALVVVVAIHGQGTDEGSQEGHHCVVGTGVDRAGQQVGQLGVRGLGGCWQQSGSFVGSMVNGFVFLFCGGGEKNFSFVRCSFPQGWRLFYSLALTSSL
jgi:hypothetical protein